MTTPARNLISLIAFLLLAGFMSLPAQANEESIKKTIEARLGAPVDSVAKTPYLGLYEVFAAGQSFYTDDKVTVIIAGSMYDGKNMKDVTGQTRWKEYAQQFSKLPFDKAIKVVRGKGQRVMVTFEDPNCGYCKRLARDITTMDNVTVYTFLLPILSPDSEEKARNIWCSQDRAKAWSAWMLEGAKPGAGKAGCPWNKDDMMALGQKFSVHGTPAILFADGEYVSGALPAAELEKRLAKAH